MWGLTVAHRLTFRSGPIARPIIRPILLLNIQAILSLLADTALYCRSTPLLRTKDRGSNVTAPLDCTFNMIHRAYIFFHAAGQATELAGRVTKVSSDEAGRSCPSASLPQHNSIDEIQLCIFFYSVSAFSTCTATWLIGCIQEVSHLTCTCRRGAQPAPSTRP